MKYNLKTIRECSDMNLFVQNSDYYGALRDYRLRKIGI